MTRIGTSFSELDRAVTAAETASREALSRAGIPRADIAFVFSTIHHRTHFSDALEQVRKTTGASTVLGASGYGILTEEGEIERQPAIAVMVIRSDELDAVSFCIPNLQESSFRAGEKAAETVNRGGIAPRLVMIFPDTFSFNASGFFDGFESATGYTPVIGGTASEDGSEERSFQFHGSEVSIDSVTGVALNGNFQFETGITQTCQPFGEPIQVTRADGNLIYEIDGRPAYDIFLEYLSQIEHEVPDETFRKIFLGLPMRSFQTEFLQPHYLTRNIMEINEKKGALSCATPVEQGDFMTFAVRDSRRARHATEKMLRDLRERLGDARPLCGFYFNCCARGLSLYGRPNQDIALIRRAFPGVPVIGFFSYGEIAPVDHVNHLHHYSGALTLLARNP